MNVSPIAAPGLRCPAATPAAGTLGVERVAVDDAKGTLAVTFTAELTGEQWQFMGRPGSYTLTGGRRTFPRVVRVGPASAAPPGRTVVLTLNEIGDFSVYTLTLTPPAAGPAVDPHFASKAFRFRLDCDDPFDCRPAAPAADPAGPDAVVVDYLAKDYAGFRQALLEFVPTRLPAWTERSEADIGMMLLELFAAAADTLSYTQDRVATEAFLDTAGQRRSVAGHLALIDYEMEDGLAAAAYLQFEADPGAPPRAVPAGFRVATQPARAADPEVVFETHAAVTVRPAHNGMTVAAPPGGECVLPAGALTLTLACAYPDLRAGDYVTVDGGDERRDVVLLTRVGTAGGATVIEWSAATPLRHDYPIDVAPGRTLVVRGNVAPATHGKTVTEDLYVAPRPPAAGPDIPRLVRKGFRLPGGALAYLRPETPGLPAAPAPAPYPARTPRGVSTLTLEIDGEKWEERPSLLNSGPADRHVRVELDAAGDATVRFGKAGAGFGAVPETFQLVKATYRVGGGVTGNVPAGSLVVIQAGKAAARGIRTVTNPLPAAGGRDPETRDHARRVGPAAFRRPLVALTAADYEAAAEDFADAAGRRLVQRANAAFRWTGSWLTATVAVDPYGATQLSKTDADALRASLDGRRLAGYDVALAARTAAVPVELTVEISARPGARAADVRTAAVAALGAGLLPDGGNGFFHPDNFTFGQKLYVSRVYTAVAAVPGVAAAHITRLCPARAAAPDRVTRDILKQGYLAVGPAQLIRLDNDRNFPENGTLTVRVTEGDR